MRFFRPGQFLPIARMARLTFVLAGASWIALHTLPALAEESVEHQSVWQLIDGKKVDTPLWANEVPDLWYEAKPNVRREHSVTLGGKTVFSVVYHTDENGLRVVPLKGVNARKNTVYFFGCSFVFGQGVEDNETLPYYFAREAQSFRPLNYAFPGFGTQQMLVRLMKPQGIQNPAKGRKILIYAFPDFHIRRVIGAMELVRYSAERYAYYYLKGSGASEQLVAGGDFASGRPVLTTLYKWFWNSGIPERFHLGMPSHITEYDRRLTARIIQKSFEKFRETTGNGEPYVLLYPGFSQETRDAMVRLFQEFGVPYLDYSKLLPMIPPKYVIAGDTHPMPLTNRILAKQLVKDLKLAANAL
jgi:hypothetical protein